MSSKHVSLNIWSEEQMVSIVFYLFQSCRCFSVVTRTQNNKTTLFRVKPFLAHQMSYCTTISRRSGSETWATLQFTAPVLWDTIACIIPQECIFFFFFALYALCQSTITLHTLGCFCIDLYVMFLLCVWTPGRLAATLVAAIGDPN